jgi:hypothetical protein
MVRIDTGLMMAQYSRNIVAFLIILNKNYCAKLHPSRRCLDFEVVGGLEWSNDPESYAGGSLVTGRASHAGKVKSDDPD